MKTEIYMVRHAHSIFNINQEATREISQKGWQDAELVTEILVREDIDVFISSPYKRAIQTIEGAAKELHKDIVEDDRFKEGTLAHADYIFENHQESLRYAFNNPAFSYPGGETAQELRERGTAAIQEVLTTYKGKKIAIGIHGNIMTNILYVFDKKFDIDFWTSTTKPDIYKMTFEDDQLAEVTRLWKENTQLAR